jgi:predicted RNA-binding Zn-ribbon protein involved in translation (DUF1610 family)
MTTQQCPMCGEWIDEDAAEFCPNCGETVTPDDAVAS